MMMTTMVKNWKWILLLFHLLCFIQSGIGVQLKRGPRRVKIPAADNDTSENKPKPREVLLEGGGFRMGSSDRELMSTGEYPLKNIHIKRFKIDRFPVTNADFKAFKHDKPHYETIAETTGHSWVFIRHKTETARFDRKIRHRDGDYWVAVRNATWSQPFGPGSSIDDLLNCPVVHVSYYDAYAYCGWAGKRLPSEYEWEYASRGGINDTRFPWGNKSEPMRSNVWQGRFPDYNLAKDGYDGLSPVDAFREQNDFGLHDMIGNVWEWTSTVFTIPRVANDPKKPQYSVKGGSYLDPFDGLTAGRELRNSARLGYDPTYTAANLGFRCSEHGRPVKRVPVRHRLEDTWDYKVRNMLVGSNPQRRRHAEEL